MNRRDFLAGASLSAWLAAAHGSGMWAEGAGLSAEPVRGDGPPRIRNLRLETGAPLTEMRAFYRDVLELPILEEGPGELTIGAGETPITFVAVEAAENRAPFYHFAFNIPENKLPSARDWQRARTPLIPPWPGLRDPDFPSDVVHFVNWNAHSVFFWDPAGNLLEHIARHDLRNGLDGPFSSRDILYVSEIAFIVDDVADLVGRFEKVLDLGLYRPGSDRFAPVGDELGLLLVMKRGRILGFDEGRPAEVFGTGVTLQGERPASLDVPGYPFRVVSS